jgi:hypothetical protein
MGWSLIQCADMSLRCVVGLVFAAFSLQSGFAQPLAVNGVNDRSDNNVNTASFIVPADPGHSYLVLLDGKRVPAGVTNRVVGPDYHEIAVWRTNATTGQVTNRLVRFVIMSDRGDPERGLIAWTPYPQVPSANAELAGAGLQLMAPAAYPAALQIPVIARVENPSGHARRVNGSVTSPGQPSFRILRGHGSGFLSAGAPGTPIDYGAQLGPISANKEIDIDLATSWMTVSGTLPAGNNIWPEDSRIHITGNITLLAGSTLTIGAGTVVKINPLINITNSGQTVINGRTDRPVVFTSTNTAVLPDVRTYAWGGFFLRNAGASLTANGCIFVGGGGATGIDFSPGSSHKSHQAVFLVHSSARMSLTNCAVINTAGQVANGYNSDITYDHCHFQRAVTAGESVGGTIIINHCAIIEFPEDNGVVNATIADYDYDAVYFTTGTHLIYNSLIGFCKDDAVDSGSGGGGTVLITNCWIESALHEANAWSNDSGLRQAETYNSVLMNSGQGFECGWSGPAGSPACYAGNILSMGNSVGTRFGDNYPSIGPYNGILRVTNSFVLYNYRDVWGMTWRTDSTGWYYRSNQMDIRSNYLSQANVYHPSNSLWNGAQDGWRLASFMTTPPDAPVGIGFATWTNTLPISVIFDGIPVRLSSFTTNTVQVDYVFQAGVRPPISGTLTFAPGETLKRVFPFGFDVATYSNPRVILANAVGGELTGNTNVQFQGTAPGSVPNPVFGYRSQHDQARIQEGYPLGLTAPSGLPFTAGYEYRWAGGILSTGLITFASGETLAWAAPPETDLTGIDVVQFRLLYDGLPANVSAYYIKLPPPAPLPPPTLLIASNAFWKYPNVAGQPAANWRDLSFPDGSWLEGRAQLGFSNNEENDEATLIANLNQITYYFRHVFTVADPNVFGDLSLTLLRDDGGVVHLNGREVYRSPNLSPLPAVIGHTTTTLPNQNGENTIDLATVSATNLVAGQNIAAVDIHQQGSGSSDVSFSLQVVGNPAAPPPVYIFRYGNQLLVAWTDPAFVLEQTDSLGGTWGGVLPPGSPYVFTPNPSIPQKFFRLRK